MNFKNIVSPHMQWSYNINEAKSFSGLLRSNYKEISKNVPYVHT